MGSRGRCNTPGLSDRHDVELMDPPGCRLARARLPEGVAGITPLHELIGRHLVEGAAAAEVLIGLETDRVLLGQPGRGAGHDRGQQGYRIVCVIDAHCNLATRRMMQALAPRCT